MRMLGAPEVLIDIVKSFSRKDMLDAIEVMNGLRQGCTVVPTLFNLCSETHCTDYIIALI